NPATPACNTAAPLRGQCSQCSGANVNQCPLTTPACNLSTGSCAGCNGDRNSGASSACVDAANPSCTLGGANEVTCTKCLTDSDCGGGHTGPTCDAFSGACIDVDSDGDTVNNTVERLLGTNPSQKDSDNDGIDDNIELTVQGGSAFAKVDTDGDGII